MKIKVFRYIRGLLPLSPSDTMIAPPPTGSPGGGSITIQKTPCPPCLAEALMWESIVKSKIFMDRE
jgi:hypothetical protein